MQRKITGWSTRGIAVVALWSVLFAASANARTWPAPQVQELARAAAEAPLEGLPAPTSIEPLLRLQDAAAVDPSAAPARDTAADVLFAALADAYARGIVAPETVDARWRLPRPAPPDITALESALDRGASPRALLQGLLPQTPEYRALRTELARLVNAANSADAGRRDQLRANLERWRWLPRTLPARRVEVRIAQFALFLYDSAAPPERYRAIVGARRTQSPVFSAIIQSFTLNPDWTPPSSIVRELLPRFRANPDAAAREGFEAITEEGTTFEPGDVDWRAEPFPYRLRQRPGPLNALGRLRFDLPNPDAVFLHDTPIRTLFARSDRALSHGCIRVENPVALAARLAAPDMDAAAIEAEIATDAQRTIPLATPTPVFVLYLTVSASPDGAVSFLNDIYRRDGRLIAAVQAATLGAPASQLALRTEPHTCSP